MLYRPPVWACGVAIAALGLAPLTAPAAVKVWKGGVKEGRASIAANWSDGRRPAEGDDIVVPANAANTLVWDAPRDGLPTTLNSWRQENGYVGKVTLGSLFGDRSVDYPELAIRTDLTLLGGTWYVARQGTNSTARLTLRVGGTLTVGTNAVISASGSGYPARSGPGYPASHGGRGFAGGPTYDSILAPAQPGSGSAGQSGGGALALQVAGASLVDGIVKADGIGWHNGGGGGAGGSILVRTATLAGRGTLSANGASDPWQGGGGGGRIAVILTKPGADFTSFNVSNITAYGTAAHPDGKPSTAAGTVYLETAQDGAGNGLVLVRNDNHTPSDACTAIPPVSGARDPLDGTRWVVQQHGCLQLVSNVAVASVTLAESAELDLGTSVLKTRALTVGDTTYAPGFYRPADLGYRGVMGTGCIAVQPPGGPEVALRGVTRITATSAQVSGTLVSGAGTGTTVTAYWGPTDGVHTPERWARHSVLQPDANGSVGLALADLPANAGCWVVLRAVNAKGEWWTDPARFFMTGSPSVSALVPSVNEASFLPLVFSVSRPASCAGGPLTVAYTLGGTATASNDYLGPASGSVTLAPDATQAIVRVYPTFDLAAQPTRTVTLDLQPGAYNPGPDTSASATIADARIPVPDWWSSVPVRLPDVPTNTAPDAYWWAMQATNAPMEGQAIDGWYVIGPFEGTNGGFEVVYPPEKGFRREAVKGRGGVDVTWQEWKPGTPCPVNVEPDNTIVYLARTFTTDGNDGFLRVEADDNARVWIDDQVVHTNVMVWNAVVIPLKLPAGSHRLLVKVLNVTAGWNCRVNWCAIDPRLAEVKRRALYAAHFPHDPNVVASSAERIAYLATDLRDPSLFAFWATTWMATTPERGRLNDLSRYWLERVRNVPALSDAFGQLLERAAGRDPDTSVRRALAAIIVDWADFRKEPDLAARALRAAQVAPSVWDARRMLALYGRDVRGEQQYWLQAYCVAEDNPNELGYVIRSFQSSATDLTLPLLYGALENAMLAPRVTAERRAQLTRRYMDVVFERNDSRRLHDFMKNNAVLLAGMSPWETIMWRLKAALMDLDQDAARTALNEAVAMRPAYAKSHEFVDYEYRVLQIRARVTSPTETDFSIDAIQNNVQKLARGETADALYRLIRDTLTQKGAQVVASDDDRDLFVGSKTRYRAMAAPYRAAYVDYLSRYTAQIEQSSSSEARATAARLRALAGLDTAPLAAPALLPPAGLHNLALAGLRPVASLPPGVFEWAGDTGRYELRTEQPTDLCSAEPAGDLVLVQNSRALAAVRGSQVLWSRALPLALPWPGADAPLFTGNRLVPAVAGPVVAARLVLPTPAVGLVGLSRNDGTFLWQWNGGEAAPVSSPAVWGTNRFVFLASLPGDTQWTHKLQLVVVEAATGRTLLCMPLCQAQRDLFVGGVGRDRRLEFYRTAPRPTIEGNVAYIDTAAGMVGAIDLADESVLWLRVYPRQLDPLAMAGRHASSPVSGRANILFAPFDSNMLLLVDKRTGRTVERRTDLPWTRVAPCGSGMASVLTGSAAYWLGLERLDEVRRLVGRNWRHVQSFGDGVLIQDGTTATLYTESGTAAASLKVPPDVMLALWANGTCYGFCGADGSTLATVEPAPVQAAAPVAMPVAPCDTPVQLMRTIPVPSGSLLLVGDGLCRFDDQGQRIWEVPADSEASVAADATGRIGLLHAGRVWLLRDADGRATGLWPTAASASTNPVLRLASSAGVLYALVSCGRDSSNRLVRLNGSVPQPVGYLPSSTTGASDFLVTEQGSRAAVAFIYPGNAGEIFKLPDAPPARDALPAFERVAEAGRGQFMVCPDDTRRRIFALRSVDRTRWLLADGMLRQDTLPGDGPLWADWSSPAGPLAVTPGKGSFSMLDPDTGHSVDLHKARCWMAAGTTVYGVFGEAERAELATDNTLASGYLFGKGDTTTGTPFRIDLRAGGQPATGKAAAFPMFEHSQRAGQVSVGSQAALLLRLNNEQTDLSAIVWDGSSPDPRTVMFPRLPLWSGVNQAGPHLAVVNETPVGEAELLRYLTPGSLVRRQPAGDTQPVPRVDGFIDEWPADAFTATAKARYALRRCKTPDDLWLAVEVTDPALVACIARSGLDRSLQFLMVPGGSADFAMDSSDAQIKPLCLTFPDRTPKVDAAWAFAPDASRVTMEIHVAESGVLRRPSGRAPSPEAEVAGDAAFRLVWQPDPFTPAVNLLGGRTVGPLSFERILFTADAPAATAR